MPAPALCLVHLVWAPLGPEPLARFVASYRRHDAGTPHRLVLLLNGFSPEHDLGPWRRALDGIDHEELRLDSPVLDLAAYREAVLRVEAERYCLVNSYSEILAELWLAHLERALLAPDAGLVCASGSWGSIRSYQRFMLGLGGPYAKIFGDRRDTNATLEAAALAARPPSQSPKTRREPLRFARTLAQQSHGFAPFPAVHVRTTGLMFTREVWSRLRVRPPRSKSDAYRLESGRRGITAQVREMGLAARVVGRDGRAYDPPDWPASRTFWAGEQENLLIADNQSSSYAAADAHTRMTLARFAWGQSAGARDPA